MGSRLSRPHVGSLTKRNSIMAVYLGPTTDAEMAIQFPNWWPPLDSPDEVDRWEQKVREIARIRQSQRTGQQCGATLDNFRT